jgi:predicted methyltransferase
MTRVFKIASLVTLLALPALPASPADPAPPASPAQKARGRLLSPLNLGVLEGADREQWNKPDQIMDALRIADGSKVGEIGAGGGWFTMHLARRVRQNGTVYAEDVQPEMIEAIRRRVEREGLRNVTTVLGTTRDSHLPHGLDAVLINGAYNEMENPVAVLKDAAESLKAQGRIAIVDYTPGGGGPGPEAEQRVSAETVIKGAEAAGLKVISREDIPPFMFMVILGKPAPSRSSR